MNQPSIVRVRSPTILWLWVSLLLLWMSYLSCWTRRAGFSLVDNPVTKKVFKQRVRHWAGRLDVKIQWLGVRPMSNKWAYCSTNGHLNFNSELLGYDQDVWDYVIVHELLHFFVPNHGKLWKSLMRAHLGEYEKKARKLKISL